MHQPSSGKILAPAHTFHPDEVRPFVGNGREIHLVREFSGKGRSLLCRRVVHAMAGRVVPNAPQDSLARYRIDKFPPLERRVWTPRPKHGTQPCTHIRELRLAGHVAHLVYLEYWARLDGIVVRPRGLTAAIDAVENPGLGLLRERVLLAVRDGPVTWFGCQLAPLEVVVCLEENGVRIEKRSARGHRRHAVVRRAACPDCDCGGRSQNTETEW